MEVFLLLVIKFLTCVPLSIRNKYVPEHLSLLLDISHEFGFPLGFFFIFAPTGFSFTPALWAFLKTCLHSATPSHSGFYQTSLSISDLFALF